MSKETVTLEDGSAVDIEVVDITVVVETTGPEGPEGKWVQMTAAAYAALTPKDPNVLYIVVG